MSAHCLIVEDHPMLSHGLSMLLSSHFPEWKLSIASTVGMAQHAIGDNGDAKFDLVLLDLNLPDFSGLALLQHLQINTLAHPVRTLVVTAETDERRKEICRMHGANGFVPKHAQPEVIVDAIMRIMDGGAYYGDEDDADATDKGNPFLSLSDRKRDLLDLALAGLKNREIAEILGLSPGTVRNYLEAIRRDLKADNKMKLQVLASAMGYDPSPVSIITDRYRNTV